jgi:ATP-dependent protease HslVU (ClpYQ) ATPase subunit
MSKKYVTNNEAARSLGMKPSAFAKGVRQGRFTASKKNSQGNLLFDLEKISEEYKQTKDTAFLQDRAAMYSGGRPKEEGILTPILKAKTASETIKAQTQKLKLDALTGRLIDKEVAEKQGAELGIILMGAMDSWAARLAPELSSMKNCDEHDFHLKITREVNILKQEIIKKCSVETK